MVTQTIQNPSDDVSSVEVPFVVLYNVSWQTYQSLLADMGEHRAARLAYHHGVLEIKMPSKLHELINRLLERIITTLTEELEMNVLALGSTTFEQEEIAQGVEPDSCFYIQNAEYVNLEDNQPPTNLPPDLVVEVDITSSSKSRLSIYRIMGVPEIWRYHRQGLVILQLQAGQYVECEYSLAFPKVTGEFLRVLVEQGKQAKNQNAVMQTLRNWLSE
ncbi:Uma2 family endonuclease [Nostoc sp. TCL26-01]|uniref:Uma2 family endonuclease n=1 Tax=Nostoc sp. TCL26-01 TaxID=2576904 RepID=UPI0015BA2645|nr:Uma2 family endonuclease [Nostoc sp. TCL26-01]QLE57078.1 Uma2 family endonuclease [Nostoc sp. TCL26-01]